MLNRLGWGEDIEHHRHPGFTVSQQGGGVMGRVAEPRQDAATPEMD